MTIPTFGRYAGLRGLLSGAFTGVEIVRGDQLRFGGQRFQRRKPALPIGPLRLGAERPAQIAGPDRPGEAPRLVQAHRHGESPRLPGFVERRPGLHAGSR